MTLPTSRQRDALLLECLSWVGKYYEGGSVADCCHVAVREALHLPLDNRPLRRDMFVGDEYDAVRIPYGELLGLGLVSEASGADLRIAETIRRRLRHAMSQSDLNKAQVQRMQLESMVDAVEYWLTWTPGGLAEAVQDLFVLIKGGFPTSPFV
jgi:hypothetical protein